jgi:hypothetical protein
MRKPRKQMANKAAQLVPAASQTPVFLDRIELFSSNQMDSVKYPYKAYL